MHNINSWSSSVTGFADHDGSRYSYETHYYCTLLRLLISMDLALHLQASIVQWKDVIFFEDCFNFSLPRRAGHRHELKPEECLRGRLFQLVIIHGKARLPVALSYLQYNYLLFDWKEI